MIERFCCKIVERWSSEISISFHLLAELAGFISFARCVVQSPTSSSRGKKCLHPDSLEPDIKSLNNLNLLSIFQLKVFQVELKEVIN